MVQTNHASERGTDPGGVARVSGRYRLPSDVLSELRQVLAGDPEIVVLDLVGIASPSSALATVLSPLADYLVEWPGTRVIACVPDPKAAAAELPRDLVERVGVLGSAEVDLSRQSTPPPQARAMDYLAPLPEAVEQARTFTVQTLREWGIEADAGPATLVVSELVTHSILHAQTIMGLALSHLPSRVRIAVHDHGTASLNMTRLAEPVDLLEETMENRGLRLVDALTLCWGIFPQRTHGKTIWAVIEAAPAAVAAA